VFIDQAPERRGSRISKSALCSDEGLPFIKCAFTFNMHCCVCMKISGEADLSRQHTPATAAEAFAQADIMNAALNSKLAAYRENAGRIRPDFARAYDELVARY
jgi:hypothetical protein